MASDPHSLQAAAQAAQSREDAAARALTEFQQRLTEQQHRLQQLLLFRNEYAIQFQQESDSGLSARRFQDYAAFLNNLDQGIVQSRQQLDRLLQELQRKRQGWIQAQARTRALEDVIERDRRAQARRQDYREQRDSDERNLLLPAIRRRFAGGHGA